MPKTKYKRKRSKIAARRVRVAERGVHGSMMAMIKAVKEAAQAEAEAEKKVRAAKLIAYIAKEAGIQGPPAAAKKKAISRAKKKVAAARKKANKRIASAKKKAKTTNRPK